MKIKSRNIMAMLSGLAMTLFSITPAVADDHFEFWPSQVPVICGETKPMLEFIAKDGMIPFTVSFGRVDGLETGALAFVVTIWVKPASTEQMVSIQKPDGTETCILYKSFDTTVNPNFEGKGLNL